MKKRHKNCAIADQAACPHRADPVFKKFVNPDLPVGPTLTIKDIKERDLICVECDSFTTQSS